MGLPSHHLPAQNPQLPGLLIGQTVIWCICAPAAAQSISADRSGTVDPRTCTGTCYQASMDQSKITFNCLHQCLPLSHRGKISSFLSFFF